MFNWCYLMVFLHTCGGVSTLNPALFLLLLCIYRGGFSVVSPDTPLKKSVRQKLKNELKVTYKYEIRQIAPRCGGVFTLNLVLFLLLLCVYRGGFSVVPPDTSLKKK